MDPTSRRLITTLTISIVYSLVWLILRSAQLATKPAWPCCDHGSLVWPSARAGWTARQPF